MKRLVLIPHLAGDEHVFTTDDALLDLVMDSFTEFHLILVTEGCIQVTVTGRNGSLCCCLANLSCDILCGGKERFVV